MCVCVCVSLCDRRQRVGQHVGHGCGNMVLMFKGELEGLSLTMTDCPKRAPHSILPPAILGVGGVGGSAN